jgi:hypothetical protein
MLEFTACQSQATYFRNYGLLLSVGFECFFRTAALRIQFNRISDGPF